MRLVCVTNIGTHMANDMVAQTIYNKYIFINDQQKNSSRTPMRVPLLV